MDAKLMGKGLIHHHFFSKQRSYNITNIGLYYMKGLLLFKHVRGFLYRIRRNLFVIGLSSFLWLIFRTGSKPSRVIYPCQRVAAANGYIWFTVYLLPLLFTVPKKISRRIKKKKLAIAVVVVMIGGSVVFLGLNEAGERPKGQELNITEMLAKFQPASDIFVVDATSGSDIDIDELINLMGSHGLLFYKSPVEGLNRGSAGLVARDDVIIIKINSQWSERGGTNTDLLKALIQAILRHPDGFMGEIIVADNGQNRGSLAWSKSNAENLSQSVQKVAGLFTGSYKVSTYLWDRITMKRVKEYHEGDMEDGYIVNTTVNPRTGLMVSYPKFKTKFGTHVSFKLGIWDSQRRGYDSERLKVINVPVLKSHSGFGVTACVKHYMGVVSNGLTAERGASSHQTVGRGGMGTEMAETRFPTLNILDAIWVNAIPKAGPGTPYTFATRVNVVAASTDPIALDYWASKYILLKVAKLNGHSNVNSMDPDNTGSDSFGHWLRASMQEIRKSGYQATLEESYMNVYVQDL